MLIKRLQPVEESYFGKSRTLVACEGVIKSIIKELKIPNNDKLPQRVVDTPKLNKSDLNKKLQDLLQKQFGFGEMYVHWDGSDVPNAYSFTKGIIKLIGTDMPKLPVKQADGGYYDEGHSYLCTVNVYAGLIDAGLSAEEILAVMLHEIGHNFDCTPMTTLLTFTDLLWIPINVFEAVTSLEKAKDAADAWRHGKEMHETLWDILKARFNHEKVALTPEQASMFTPENIKKLLTDPFFNMIIYTRDFIVAMFRAQEDTISAIVREYAPELVQKWLTEMDQYIEDHKNAIKAELKVVVERQKKAEAEIKKNGDALLYMPLLKFFKSAFGEVLVFKPVFFLEDIYNANRGFGSEVFADSFATAYGYGPALASAFNKFSNSTLSSRFFDKKNKNNAYNQYIIVCTTLIQSVMDPHPMDQTRMKNQVNKLKRELAEEGVPPELKASIQRDLTRIEKIYNGYLEMDPKFRHLSIIMNFRSFNNTYFGGKMDLRDFINRVVNAGKAEA